MTTNKQTNLETFIPRRDTLVSLIEVNKSLRQEVVDLLLSIAVLREAGETRRDAGKRSVSGTITEFRRRSQSV